MAHTTTTTTNAVDLFYCGDNHYRVFPSPEYLPVFLKEFIFPYLDTSTLCLIRMNLYDVNDPGDDKEEECIIVDDDDDDDDHSKENVIQDGGDDPKEEEEEKEFETCYFQFQKKIDSSLDSSHQQQLFRFLNSSDNEDRAHSLLLHSWLIENFPEAVPEEEKKVENAEFFLKNWNWPADILIRLMCHDASTIACFSRDGFYTQLTVGNASFLKTTTEKDNYKLVGRVGHNDPDDDDDAFVSNPMDLVLPTNTIRCNKDDEKEEESYELYRRRVRNTKFWMSRFDTWEVYKKTHGKQLASGLKMIPELFEESSSDEV